ncbi:MAG TPA: GNAT family N-acetyltransferase [Streptosporangiaceae bacterium]|nr:GNAT family N-acetyltransferase [Streptosporangiaceae bacterium]
MNLSKPDSSGLVPRRATNSDLPEISRLIRQAYAKYAERMDRPPGPVLKDYVAETEAGQVWVTGEPITGVIVLIDMGDSLLVENVAVGPDVQGTGIGRGLMDFAEQKARTAGRRRVTLYTHEVMTENLAIYRHLGYRETERRTEDGYRRVFMERALPDL